MLIRTHPAMSILFDSHRTTLPELPALSGNAVRKLYQYVTDLDLLICGPSYWFYYGADGQSDTSFTLEVALPVFGSIPTALLPFFKKLPSTKCLYYKHEGTWQDLPLAYNKMWAYISAQGLQPSGISWEAFLHVDPSAPENNVTEISIGLS